MGNPSDERTTINVKGVSVSSWERAKNAAKRQDESMGAWLSRAAEYLANLEDGPRELPPLAPANPAQETGNPIPAPVEGLGVLMQGMAALAAATGTAPAKADTRRLYALVDDQVRQARGLPPRPVRRRQGGLANGQSLLENGKAIRS